MNCLSSCSAASLAAHNGIPPGSLVLAGADADVVAVAVRIAVTDGEAVSEAGEALRGAVQVARQALVQHRVFESRCLAAPDSRNDIPRNTGVLQSNLKRAVQVRSLTSKDYLNYANLVGSMTG